MENVKKTMVAFLIAMAVTFVVVLISCMISDAVAMIFVFLLIAEAIADSIYTMVKWRCPCCNRRLPRRWFYWVEACPYCKEELD